MGVGNLATNLGNQEKIINEGALQPLLSLARRDNGDLESQRYAVFALTNVAATRSNHARLIGAGVCELMAALLEADDVEIRNSAAFCVGNFASNPDNHATLLDEGVLGPLINLVASADPQVLSCAAPDAPAEGFRFWPRSISATNYLRGCVYRSFLSPLPNTYCL